MTRSLIAALILASAACHTPAVSEPWREMREHVRAQGPGCYLHWGELTQSYADRLVPVCEEIRKPEQTVYTLVMSERQAADLLASGYFGWPPPFNEVRGYYVRSNYLSADQIAINETVLDDGAERSLMQHELCHSLAARDDPVCGAHTHGPPDVSGASQALTQAEGITVYVTGEVGGALVTVPIEQRE